MAVVLDALAPYLIQTIKDMAEDELRMLLGISGDIQRLSEKMKKMEAYLADAERRRIDNPTIQDWVNQLKGAMYEATDILDLCQLDAEDRKRSPGGCWPSLEKKAPGCLQPLLFCLRNPSFARSMGKRIKALNARLDEISNEMSSHKFVKMNSYQVKTLTSEVTPHSRVTTSLIDESAIVGDAIQAATRALVQVLLADEPATTILVVSIVGAGGMGKTTLAKMIFNDRDIQMAFRSKIWLSVTETYEEKKLLRSSIAQAGGGKEPPTPSEDKEVLTKTLADVLSSSTGKVLVVMDDVWSEHPWTDVLQSPIIEAARKQPGSRVIITTRNENLVKYMGATYHQHHVKPLGDEDAWSLLKKQVQPQATSSESDLDHLKHIGMGIIRKCDGLPLAIKAVGGLLKTKKGNENGWTEVLDAPTWSTDKTHHDLNSAVRLSYEDLSPPLKQCFLYYSLLPKGLHVDTVIGMWMSEGLVVSQQGRDRWKEAEDVSMGYYWDLIARNLLEPDFEIALSGSFSRMHDVVRSFAQHMAKEEALAIRPGQVISPRLLASSKFRRLCIGLDLSSESPSVVQSEWSSISGKQELLRSLLIIGRMRYDDEPSSSTLSTFPSLRALLVEYGEFDRFVDSLSKLKHLRFLDLEATDISRLPDDIDNMRFLEHIRLAGCPNFDGQLPSSIKKLERLRYLCLARTKFTVPQELGALSNLRTLMWFPVQINRGWCSLQELGTLSLLRRLELLGLEAVPSASLAAQAKLHDKEQLRFLYLALGNNIDYAASHPEEVFEVGWEEEDYQRVEVVFDQLCPPRHLEALSMFSYIGRRPPSWMMSVTGGVNFNSLTWLDIIGMPFCTQLPDGLCRLPSLESLIVRFAPAIKRVGPEFQRRRVNSLVPPFPRLQFLDLDRLLEWDNWEWEDDVKEDAEVTAMPALETLIIRECKLHCLPPGLASSNRRALKKLYLIDLVNLSSVHNIPSVVEVEVFDCPKLTKISGFSSLQNIRIICCPNLEVLQGAQKLDILVLKDATMETLPGYLRDVKPRYLYLRCNKKLYESLVSAGTSESDKIRHIPTRYFNVIEDNNIGESADNNIQQLRYGGGGIPIHNQVLHRQPPGRAFVGGGPIFLE